MKTKKREKILRKFFNVGVVDTYTKEEVKELISNKDYLVYDEEEVEEYFTEECKKILWSIKPKFLTPHMDLIDDDEIIRDIINKTHEGANPIILKLVGDNIDCLIKDIEMIDGKGKILADYDGIEEIVTVKNKEYYIYRIN